jgi:hypothetical protein
MRLVSNINSAEKPNQYVIIVVYAILSNKFLIN